MDTPHLDNTWDSRLSRIADFRKQHPDVWLLVDAASLATRGLISELACARGLTVTEGHLVMMSYTVLDYFMDSFFLLLQGSLDPGLGVMRFASELARDVARIGSNPDKLTIWLHRNDSRRCNEKYKSYFKFDEEDLNEKYVFKLYKLCSHMGVHGHIAKSAQMQPIEVTHDGKYVILQVPEIAILKELSVWLHGFFPVQSLCLKGFRAELFEGVREAYKLFLELRVNYDGVLKVFGNNLNELEAEIRGDRH